MQAQSYKPKYEVVPNEVKRSRMTYFYENEELPNGKTILARKERIVESDPGYTVYNARGDSVVVSEEVVRQLGLNIGMSSTLVNDDGEEIQAPVSLARIAKARELVKH